MLEVPVYAARSSLEGILIIPVAVLGIISYVTVRRHGDPARKGLIWLHFAFALHFFAYLFGCLDYALYLTYYGGANETTSETRLIDAQLRMAPLSTFLRKLGDCCILFCISGIGAGVWRVTTGKKIPGFYIPLQILGAVVAILAFVVFVRLEVAAVQRSAEQQASAQTGPRVDTTAFGKANAATVILLPVGALATVIFAIVVKIKARASAGTVLRTPTTLLVVSAALNILIQSWGIVGASFGLVEDGSFLPGRWFIMTELVIDRYGTFVQLVLLFVLASKKKNGLWTISQPWTDTQIQQVYVAHPYTPAGGDLESLSSHPGRLMHAGSHPHQVEIYTPSVQVYSQRNRDLAP